MLSLAFLRLIARTDDFEIMRLSALFGSLGDKAGVDAVVYLY